MLHTLLIDQEHSTLHVVQASAVKFGLHAGSMKFNTQNKECLSVNIIIQIIYICIILYIMCNKNILIIIRQINKQYNSHQS